MKEFLSLRLMDRLRKPITAMGADYPVFRRILQVKLTMDSRRMPTALSGSGSKDPGGNEKANYFLRSLWVYLLFGAIMIPFVLMGGHYIFQMSLVFGMMMFMIATSLIADFSSVLLDVKDKTILYTRPVGRRTVALVKVAHVSIYLSQITGTLAVPALIAGTIRHGLAFGALFAVLTILSVVLLLVLTALFYLAVLKLFDGEKLKDFINYVQIGLAVGMSVGYQLIGRAFDWDRLKVSFVPEWWHAFIPPLWYGSVFEWLLKGNTAASVVGLALLGLLIPFVGLAAYIKLLPAFERYLQKLSEQQSGNVRRGRWPDWTSKAAELLCRTPGERACFRFAAKMMGQERDFKLKVYPSLGFSLIFPFIFMFNGIQNMGLERLASSRWYLTLYLGATLVPTVLPMLRYSGKHKGAWIFKALPMQDYSPVFKGAMKAFIVRLLLPVFLLQSTVVAVLFGWRILPQLAVIAAVMLLFTLLCYLITEKVLPFSVPFEAVQQPDFGKIILMMLLMAALCGVHAAATFVPFGEGVYLLLLVALNLLVWRWAFPKKGIRAADLARHGGGGQRLSL